MGMAGTLGLLGGFFIAYQAINNYYLPVLRRIFLVALEFMKSFFLSLVKYFCDGRFFNLQASGCRLLGRIPNDQEVRESRKA
jgi:hypothetical protein